MAKTPAGADEAADDLRRMGMNETEIEAVLAEYGDGNEESIFEVWQENTEAVAVFLACKTQWRVGAMGGVLGLEYPGVEIVMRRRRVKDRDEVFDALQAMESAAIKILNRKRDV